MEIQEFKSLGDFSAWLDSHEPAGYFKGRKCDSQEVGDKAFFGTESWGDAQRLLLEGDPDSFKQLEAARVPAPRGGGQTAVIKSGPVGFAPNVPAYLAGRPDSMLRTVHQRGSSPVVDVVWSVSVGGGITAAQVASVANVFFNAITRVEESGRSIRLYVSDSARVPGEAHAYRCLVKGANERISCFKLAYCVINPSFLRRHGFRWLECCGCKSSRFWGYGQVLPIESLRSAFPGCVVLDYYQCEGLTVDEVVKKIFG
jgi:hypothetical protein